MRTIERKELELDMIQPHPQNREFRTTGEEWEDFAQDIARNGIEEDLEVRLLENGEYECLKGHRRRVAGLLADLGTVWCLVKEATDEEAFQAVWRGNMRRENLTPYDEACAVRGMVDLFGRSVEEIAETWGRGLDWVRTRQRMLDLGEEVMDAVRRPGRDRLSMGAVEEILKVPEELWAEAVQLVLHPEFELGTLNEDQAREVLRHCLIEPKAREAAWEGLRGKLAKTWRKQLERLCLPGRAEELVVVVRPLAEAEAFRGVGAETAVGNELLTEDAPEGLRWLHLAVKHGLAVQIVPDKMNSEGQLALVDAQILREAEAALADSGVGTAWLLGKRKAGAPATRTEKALADLAGEADPDFDGEEAAETLIEQGMERAVMIDFCPVIRLEDWLKSEDGGDTPLPDWLPDWARDLAAEGDFARIAQVTDWVISLRK